MKEITNQMLAENLIDKEQAEAESESKTVPFTDRVKPRIKRTEGSHVLETNYQYFLRRLDEKYPDREVLSLTQVAEFVGMDRRTVTKKIPGINKKNILSKYYVARELARIL